MVSLNRIDPNRIDPNRVDLNRIDPNRVAPGRGAPPRALVFAHTLWRGAVADRVQRGRLRDVGWPYGLKGVVVTSVAVYVVGVTLVVFSPSARASSSLVVPATLSASMPVDLVWLLIFMVMFALALFANAGLHGPWWLKVLATSTTVLVMAVWGVIGGPEEGMSIRRVVVLALAVGMVVLAILRRRRSYAWWEFPTVLALIGVSTTLGLVGIGANARTLGYEFAPVVLQQTVAVVGFLAIPAALAAGAAVAEIAVATTLVATRQTRRLAHRAWPYAILGVVVTGRLVQGIWEVAHFDPVLQGPLAVAEAVAVAAAFFGLGRVLIAVARRHAAGPDQAVVSALPDDLGRVGLPIGAALVGLYLPLILVLVVIQIGITLDPAAAAQQTLVDPLPLFDRGLDVVRLGLAVVLVVLSLRLARRGRLSMALLLGSIAVMMVVLGLRTITANRVPVRFDPDLLNLLTTLAVLVAVGWQLLRRRLTPRRAVTFAGVLVLSALFSNRDFVSDPVGALLGYSGGALVLFGLTWDFVAGSEWANGDSRRFGRPTRVLLTLSYTVLTVTMLAYAALVRDPGSATDLDAFAALGDQVLGTALLAAAFVALLGTVDDDAVTAPPPAPDGTVGPV